MNPFVYRPQLLNFFFFIAALLLLTACGSSSNGTADIKTGVFIDSPVKGLSYQTSSQSGNTNDAGEFRYVEGEIVTFQLGGIVLGSAQGKSIMTPLDMVGATAINNLYVSNMARLLQTLDDDSNPDNGIVLSPAVIAAAESYNIKFTDLKQFDLKSDPAISGILSTLGINALVASDVAVARFESSLTAASIGFDGSSVPDLCLEVTCELTQTCYSGICFEAEGTLNDACANVQCPNDDSCYQGGCFSTDACTGVLCPAGEGCYEGGCFPVDACADVLCPNDYACYQGGCFPTYLSEACIDVQCPSGDVCYEGGCFPADLCANVSCPDDRSCFEGGCFPVDACANVQCPDDDSCYQGGCFSTDACTGVLCPAGKGCYGGGCFPIDACAGVTCPSGDVCYEGGCFPVVDACAGVTCPSGDVCYEGGCFPNNISYFIGGNVSGLTGTVVLQNNNGDDLSVGANGDFTFATAIDNGLTYSVSVLTQPAGQICRPTANSGTVTAMDVTTVVVICTDLSLPDAPINVSVTSTNPKTLTFSWDAAAGATSYKLLRNPDGVSSFNEVFNNISALTVDDVIPVHLYDWVNATYMVQACNAGGCTDSEAISTTSAMIDAIGYFKASNTQAQDQFGYSLALSADGSTLAVAALGEDSNASGINNDQSNNAAGSSGAVYIFVRSAGIWSQQAYVKASNAAANDRFGYSLALSADGNTLAVGADQEASNATGIDGVQSNNSATIAGAVYVFTRSASTWSQQAYVKASNTGSGDRFGDSVALSADGNTMAVGAYGEASNATGINATGNQLGDFGPDNNSNSASGAVYVFTRSVSTWSQQAYIKASNNDAEDYFSRESLALSADGNTLAVGAWGEDGNATGINGDQNNLLIRTGAVYVFTRSVNTWQQQAYVKASNAEAQDHFGVSLALSADGDTLAVGAHEDSNATGVNGDDSDNTATDSGAVYVFIRSAGDWLQEAYVKASNTQANHKFASKLALSADGSTLAVGAIGEASNAIGIGGDQFNNFSSGAGAVYVYTRNTGTWLQRSYVKASNTGAGYTFGFSLSLSGDGETLSVGAPLEYYGTTGINGSLNGSTAINAGAVYLY